MQKQDALYVFMIKVTAAAMLIIIITKKTVKVIFFIVATKCSINLMNVIKMSKNEKKNYKTQYEQIQKPKTKS